MAKLPHKFPDIFETPEDEYRAAHGTYLFLQDGMFSFPDDMKYETEIYDEPNGLRYLHKTPHITNYAHKTNIYGIESQGKCGCWSVEVAADYGDRPWRPVLFRFVRIGGDRKAFKRYRGD